jgi:hypothetical protein
MGRHTKDDAEHTLGDDEPHGSRRSAKLPLLPAVSGVVMVGVVVSALSTKQIALNFAGGPPPPTAGTPQVTGRPAPDTKAGRRIARDDSTLNPRSRSLRASRDSRRGAVSVSFRTISAWGGGFEGQVVITNGSRTPVQGWTLSFRYPGNKILTVGNARIIHLGALLVVRNPLERPSIPPGRTVRLTFTAEGAGTQKPFCTFNGVACRS